MPNAICVDAQTSIEWLYCQSLYCGDGCCSPPPGRIAAPHEKMANLILNVIYTEAGLAPVGPPQVEIPTMPLLYQLC